MRALITGIKGAAASYLGEYLHAKGYEVFGISRSDCDMLFADMVRERIERVMPDVIYHLASNADVAGSFDRPADIFENNTAATINLLEAVRLSLPSCVVVIGSSSETYGDTDANPINEDTPFSAPTNPYAASKQAQDMLAQFYAKAYGLRIVITRAFGYVNPRRPDLALSAFAQQIVAIERGEADELVHGNLDSVRSFCDVRCVIEAYAIAATLPGVGKNGAKTGIYNIGSEEPVTVGECLQIMTRMARAPIHTRLDPKRVRPMDLRSSVPDCSRFRDATGWRPKRSLTHSLMWLLDEYRSEVRPC